ncbi:MAG: hypothetical protein WC822_06815 [Candidatus Paceibacterota bacterium]|jgi:hypothetical protein
METNSESLAYAYNTFLELKWQRPVVPFKIGEERGWAASHFASIGLVPTFMNEAYEPDREPKNLDKYIGREDAILGEALGLEFFPMFDVIVFGVRGKESKYHVRFVEASIWVWFTRQWKGLHFFFLTEDNPEVCIVKKEFNVPIGFIACLAPQAASEQDIARIRRTYSL